MFSTGLKTIYKKINQIQEADKKKAAFQYLESQLTTNPYFKHQFEVMSVIKKNKGKITTQEGFDKFMTTIKEKNKAFIAENKKASQLEFWRENKKLFEYYNINPKEIGKSKLDIAIDLYNMSKKLNESTIKKIVFRPKIEKNQQKINLLKESYKILRNKENELNLRKQFKIIRYLSESMVKDKQEMVQQSLRSLLEERYKNYPICVTKLYKLRMLSEKILQEKNIDFAVAEERETGEYGPGKRSKLRDLKFIKKIEVETHINYKRPDKIMIHFNIPVYPVGITRNATVTSALRIKDKINHLERNFINLSVYQKRRENIFDPVGTIWDILMKTQLKEGQGTVARISCYLATNKQNQSVNTWDTYVDTAYAMLKDFDQALPRLMGDLADCLTPTAQKEAKAKVKGLSQKEKQAQASTGGQVDSNLIRRKFGGDEDFENRTDNFGYKKNDKNKKKDPLDKFGDAF